MGAPLGNSNCINGKRYRKALERALAHKHGSVDDGLFELAKVRVAKALEGDNDAARELGDRFDGKPTQGVEHSGPDGAAIQSRVVVEFIAGANTGVVPVSVAAKG